MIFGIATMYVIIKFMEIKENWAGYKEQKLKLIQIQARSDCTAAEEESRK